MRQQPTPAHQDRPSIEELTGHLDPGRYDDRWDQLFRSRLAVERAAEAGRREQARPAPQAARLVTFGRLRPLALPLAAAAAVLLCALAALRLARPERALVVVHAADAGAVPGSPDPAFTAEPVTPGRELMTGASVYRLRADRTFDIACSPQTRFRLLSSGLDQPETRLELGRGRLWGATFDQFPGRGRIRIAVGPAEILVSGTRWMAEHDPDSGTVRLAVFEGRVEFQAPDHAESVSAGSLLVWDGRGPGRAATSPLPPALNRLSWYEWHRGLLLDRTIFHAQLALHPAAGRLATLRSIPFLVIGAGGPAGWRQRAVQAGMVGLAADSLAAEAERRGAHAQAAAEIGALLGQPDLPAAARPALALFAAAQQRLAGNSDEALRWIEVARRAAAELDDPVHGALGLAFELSLRAELGQGTVVSHLLAELRDRFPECPEVAELAGL